MYALSTAWNASRWQEGEGLIREIHALGFQAVELNFSLTAPMVESIGHYAKSNGIVITSLHNYCPIPEGFTRDEALPDCFSLASLTENERKRAVEATKKTIFTASSLGAQSVVLHCGRVEIKDRTRELIGLALEEKKESEQYKTLLSEFQRERQRLAPDHFAALLKSLEELSVSARHHNVTLGIETRFYYREIPSLEEFETIFQKMENHPLGYWHDTGHAFILEQLGFMPSNAHLLRLGKRLIGTHLHNIKNMQDHQAPQNGDFDFSILKNYLLPDTIKVIEAHQKADTRDVRDSVNFLKGVLDA